jgi:hypothetical protein
VQDKIINAARRLLKRDYFDRMPALNLGDLEFTVERVKGAWGDMSGVDAVNTKTTKLSDFHRSKQNQVCTLLQVQWMLAKREDLVTAV